ncbi:hypothetical protein [Methylomonas sp. AM2-LC]|uniref:hypothetical protein n=1 Tax=Methylomonas sp. AM2-LC TaxID=3153301 RepID=UPI003263C5DA
MTTQINICNLALAKLGDVANISSLTDGSMQAVYCALFYPQALSVLLQRYAWSFALRSIKLNALAGSYSVAGTVMTCVMTGHNLISGSSYNFTFTDSSNSYDASGTGSSYAVSVVDANTFTLTVASGGAASGSVSVVHPQWLYAYGLPSDFFNLVAVGDGIDAGMPTGTSLVDFAFEANVLFCNRPSAVLEYMSALALSASGYPPLFIEALSLLLASYLAGPILKGDTGVAAQQRLGQVFDLALARAVEADGLLRRVKPVYVPDAIRAHRAGSFYGVGGGQPWSGNVGGSNNIL